MINRLIFILVHPLVERDYVRYGIKKAIEKNYQVEILDCFSLYHPKKNRHLLQPEIKKNLNISYISNIFDLKNKLVKYSNNDAVVVLYPQGSIYNLIVKMLNILKITSISINAGVIPTPKTLRDENIIKSILRIIKDYSFRQIFTILISRFIKFLSYVILQPKTTYFFYGGQYGLENASNVLKKAKNLVSVHCLDYDLYITQEKIDKNFSKQLKKNKYAVFIDQNVFSDPDIYLWGDSKKIKNSDKKDYYLQLNKLFIQIEKKFNYQIYIAAHPRADYSQDISCFSGRKIIYNDTINLIKYSELCILNYSTAINFAVLYKKPIIIAEPYALKNISSKQINEFSGAFSKALKIDKLEIKSDTVFEVNFPNINEKIYSEYINCYIKEANSQNDYFWNCVYKEINIKTKND